MNYTPDPKKVHSLRKWLDGGTINIFGSPFAGKDTQGKRLAEYLDANILGGGDIIRASQDEDIKNLVADGSLAPRDQYLAMILPVIKHEKYADRPLVLSSVGRWHGEEEGVIEATNESGHETKAVVFLYLEENDARNRWKAAHERMDRGEREDDTAEALEHRFNEFKNKTVPVIEFYREKGLLIKIDGRPDENTVTENLIDELIEYSNA